MAPAISCATCGQSLIDSVARKWFESITWEDAVAVCHRCGNTTIYEVPSAKPLPHRYRSCRKHFSLRHGTLLEDSHIPLQKRATTIYLVATSLKGVSSIKQHRDLGITRKSAWHMLHKPPLCAVGRNAVGLVFCGRG